MMVNLLLFTAIVLLAIWWFYHKRLREQSEQAVKYQHLMYSFGTCKGLEEWSIAYIEMKQFIGKCGHPLREMWAKNLMDAAQEAWCKLSEILELNNGQTGML